MTVRAVVLVDVLVNVQQIVRKTAVKVVEPSALMIVRLNAFMVAVAAAQADVTGAVVIAVQVDVILDV